MTVAPSDRSKVFISYSHRDAEWLERLQVHLKPLEREGKIERWDDTLIQPGAPWREEIRRAIDSAQAAVLLVSADFLASDFITTDELPPLLAAARDQGVIVLPVILSPCLFEQTPGLAQFQSVNPPSKPLIGLPRVEQEAVFKRVAERVGNGVSSTVIPSPRQSPLSTASPAGGARLWLDRKRNWILAGLGVAVLMLLLAGFFALKPEPAPAVRADGGVAAGRDIRGSTITITNPDKSAGVDEVPRRE